jgi:protoporphyrinogen oxidase
MASKNCVVVGGGLCGLFASIRLADKFDQVYIIEKDNQCGGLLRSVKDDRGIVYDLGTHVPDQTLIPEIDEILFGTKEEIGKTWNELGVLKSGNFFSGKWNLENPTPDSRLLPQDIYEKGIVELISRTEPSHADDIVTYLVDTIGPTFTNEIAAPVVKKLYDADPTTLTTATSVMYFGLFRVIAFTREVSNKLKELEAFDLKLGYHNLKDNLERLDRDNVKFGENYYPKMNVGVYSWIQRLQRLAEEKGVIILNNESVKKIIHNGNLIKSVVLDSNGETIDLEFLLWTVPPVFALKAAGIRVPKANLTFRTANIFHYSYDKPLLDQTSHYLWNWDGSYKGFRITLYPNMQPDIQPPLNNVTIEALSSKEEADGITLEHMHDEMVRMGLVAEDAIILSQLKQTTHDTFPVPTFEFERAVKNNYNQLCEAFDNVFIAGRFGGKNWFHRDVVTEVYNEINHRFDDSDVIAAE